MRVGGIVIVLAAVFASPAAADITARYVSPMTSAVGMTIEVNDKGDARAGMSNTSALLILDGVTYILASDLSGPYAVKQEDWVAVETERMRTALPAGFGSRPDPAYEIVAGGQETIGGRTGTVWSLRRAGEARSGEIDFVICGDPDLAEIGRLFARQFNASMGIMRSLIGSTPDMFAKLEAIMAKGAVIRAGRLLRLDSVDNEPIPPSEFAFPGPLLSREDYAARAAPRAAH